MTAYARIEDFIKAFGEEAIALTNLSDPDSEAVDPVALQRALDDATNEIAMYLASRYKLPIAQVPPTLRQICCDIARYRLDRNDPREDVRLRYEDAIKLLTNISKGVVSLGIPTDDPAQSAEITIGIYQNPRVFGDDALGGFNRLGRSTHALDC